MATISTTVIANMALSSLGVAPILGLTDKVKPAKVMNLWYDHTRDEVIRSEAWTFARTRAELGRLTDEPIFGWDFQYQLPVKPKCLRVLRLMEDYNYTSYYSLNNQYTGEGSAYVIESDRLLTNFETASILFLKRVTDTTKFDSMFVKAFALKLAHDACFDITGSNTKQAGLMRLYHDALNVGSGTSAKEHHRTADKNSQWVNAGHGGATDSLNERRLTG